MPPLYVGVDIAGGENTWLACVVRDGERVHLEQQPRKASLAEIVQLAEQCDVVAVAIDAQLSIAVSDENGFRSCDTELRALLQSVQGLSRRLEQNPSGFLLGRDQPEEFEPE